MFRFLPEYIFLLFPGWLKRTGQGETIHKGLGGTWEGGTWGTWGRSSKYQQWGLGDVHGDLGTFIKISAEGW